MRGVWVLMVCVFAACAIACGGTKATRPEAKPKEVARAKVKEETKAEEDEEKEPEDVPPEKSKIKPAGRIRLTGILDTYELANNRAEVADKYFGKYWEIDLTDEGHTIEEDHIEASSHPAWRWISTSLYFRDKKELLKFGLKDGKRIGPRIIIGKAVSANRFVDCFIPATATK